MDASYDQDPFSYAELAAGGIALAAVALVAFLAFQRISRPLDLTASAGPSNATQSPATGAPKPPEDRSPGPDSAGDNAPAPSPAWPKVVPEAAPAAMVKPWAAAMRDALGPLNLFQMKNFVAQSAKPEEGVPTPRGASQSLELEEGAATPRGATRDPSRPSDALWIQTRLRDLGYYSGSVNGVWGLGSRRALLDFKIINGLPDGDKWDRETEQAVSSGQSVGAHGTFIGTWAKAIEACQIGHGAVVVIRPRGAKTEGGKCDFHSVKRETATTWQIQADCSAALQQPDTGSDLSALVERVIAYFRSNGAVATEEQMQRANISLKLSASRLHWRSEHGAETYLRCPKS
jgi:hypothetical protein